MNMMKYDELMEMYSENVELLEDMKKVVEEIDNLLYSLDDLWCEYIYFVDKTHILSQIAETEKEFMSKVDEAFHDMSYVVEKASLYF